MSEFEIPSDETIMLRLQLKMGSHRCELGQPAHREWQMGVRAMKAIDDSK